MPQFVKLVNNDTRPFDFHQNNEKRIVQPGQDTVVPWAVACALFGDPTLVDTPRDPARTLALKQARGTFNYMLGLETDEDFDARRPHVEVWDVETSPNARIYMLIDDPDGKIDQPGIAGPRGGDNEIATLQNQVAVLTQHLSNLMSREAARTGQQRPDGQMMVPSNDAPPTPGLAPQPDYGFQVAEGNGVIVPNSQGMTVQQGLATSAQGQAATSLADAAASANLAAQFAATMPGQLPDDTYEDLTRVPPPPIPASGVQSELGQSLDDLVPAGIGGATVDGPPVASSPAATKLPKRPGHG